MGTLANREDPNEMPYNQIFRQKNTICFENYNLAPLDMFNGLSSGDYYIRPEGRINYYTKDSLGVLLRSECLMVS